jgi:hypothetical protein
MTDPTPQPGADPGMPTIWHLCDVANAAMAEVALFVQTVNDSGRPWTPDLLAELRKYQDDYAECVAKMRAHPEAHLVETRDGPVIGARKRK